MAESTSASARSPKTDSNSLLRAHDGNSPNETEAFGKRLEVSNSISIMRAAGLEGSFAVIQVGLLLHVGNLHVCRVLHDPACLHAA